MPFAFEDDFQLTASGTFREATTPESIRQDIVHLISELDELGESQTDVFAQELRTQLIDLLSQHPYVTSVDRVDVTPDSSNRLFVSVYVNGSPLAITATSTGGR